MFPNLRTVFNAEKKITRCSVDRNRRPLDHVDNLLFLM